MLLNALNLMYCKFHVAQIIIIEDIDNIIKGALKVFLSVVIYVKCTLSVTFQAILTYYNLKSYLQVKIAM